MRVFSLLITFVRLDKLKARLQILRFGIADNDEGRLAFLSPARALLIPVLEFRGGLGPTGLEPGLLACLHVLNQFHFVIVVIQRLGVSSEEVYN